MNYELKKIHFLEYLYCLLLLVFLIGRVGFILYNHHIDDFSFLDALVACKDGLLGHDFFIAPMLLAVPWLLSLVALHRRFNLRLLLIPYYIIMGIVVGAIILADTVMYEFWQFKLCAVVLSYAASPEGATNSVSLAFILWRVVAGLALMALIAVPCIVLTPRSLPSDTGSRLWMRNISIVWTFLLVVGTLYIRIGDVYAERRLFLNHAAVNPVYAFAASFPIEKDFGARYRKTECGESLAELYPDHLDDVADSLLTTQRPDILLVFIESFGGRFVEELGGLPGVAPQWSRLIPEGIFWTNYYSNSFRTDRGTVSTYSGWLSYPTLSLMKHPEMHHQLPSLAKSLEHEGYATAYLYAGPMTNMGKRDYLENMHFRQLYDDTAFAPEELTGSWGANDSTSAMKAFHLIAQRDTSQRFFLAYQTLSSHEPWRVPYHRLTDEKLNAFAYTDHCLGQLVDSLRTLPQWDNLLVILMPDHGFLYEQSYEDPEFFHSPMLWTGGAIRSPRRMPVLMNQSDLCATLLAQMGIPHDDFPWSRNVLSSRYVRPFVYCNFPAGYMVLDPTGTTIYDLTADEPILEKPFDDGQRERLGKQILETSAQF
ncbi:MAG: sulfatase-like hydrolase/transferase [Bacteroidaceae bacterium]|nr:sulfatase-like hydrolase/transferase [Bacteroidaceae bacterium]